jgi:YidC/Oxa1 family membrane protein insertase
MEKRLLLAFILSFAVLYGFRFIFPPPPAPPADKAAAPVAVQPVTPPTPPASPGVTPADSEKTIQADAEAVVTVKNNLYEATVSNIGGVLKSFRLTDKQYLDPKGKPTELIDSYAGEKVGFPFAIATADPALDTALSQAKFVFQDRTDPNKVSVEYRAAGVHVLKSFEFNPTKYLLTVSTTVERNGAAVPHQLVFQGGFGDQSIKVPAPERKNAVYETAGSYERLALMSVGDEPPQELTATKVGVEDQYFLAMFLRDNQGAAKIGKSDYKLPDKPDGTEGAAARELRVAVPSTQPVEVFIGPKLAETLAEARPDLPNVISYGWFLFAVIAKPLLVGLRLIHGVVGNWGWAIIFLTVLVNLLMFPLKVKQQVSMQKMQKLAPQMKTLQDKYKKLKAGDPKRAEVEQELMQMNKQQLSGCLPMLLQMPLLFAFMNMMNAAIELRGAPWFLWIKDLSTPDDLYILPLSMGAAMFVQMKMSPTSPDPAQAKMMMITPILVTLLFLWYQSPSGLTLYWLTGNVIGIAQYWIIKKYWKDSDSDTPRRPRKPLPA